MKILTLFSILIFTCAFAPPTIEKNNDGVDLFKAEKYREAFQSFVDALSRDSLNPLLHFNLANGFYKVGENEKALTEFDAVENSPKADNELKYQAMFNAGNVAVEMKDFDRAFKYYQKALEHKPDSVETKTNIELALKEQQGGGGSKNDQDKKDQDQKDKKDQKDQNGKDDKEKKDQKNSPAPRPTPKPFKSQVLNENDVKSILEELKRQEQAIRAKQNQNRKKAPENQIDKDW